MRVVAVLVALGLMAAPAFADDASLYRGPAPRPGPDLLYAAPAAAPQLTNAAPWRADPILISGASAYREGEFLYQDFLYDDHGAKALPDPADPRTPSSTFSMPDGTATYPTDRAYADNAADLVELRVKRVTGATAFRLTLNSMLAPERVAATIAIGSSAAPLPFPHGAGVRAPAKLFLTVHGASADLLDAVTGARTGTPTASVDTRRRQIDVRVPDSAWDPGRSTVRLAAGVGVWDASAGRYRVPGPARSATAPGGGTGAGAAFFNVAFRAAEPLPEIANAAATAATPAWWRDRAQAEALAAGDISAFHADVDFAKLAAGAGDERGVPRTGVLDRILPSRFADGQGTDFAQACGSSAACKGELRGNLQPYALYVPKTAPAGGRYGLQLLLHSLGANYNQFSGSRNQSQFGERGHGHLVMTPAGRGPDGWYYDQAGADTFEVWADVARHYPLDPALTSIAGYSMGGYGTYKLATQFPDLFARGQPTVGPPGLGVWLPPAPPEPGGDGSNTNRQLASLRNVPFRIWNAAADELVPYAGPVVQAQTFDDLGYRYEFDTFAPAEHLTLAINDQFQPAAAFLGDARVDRDPARVTYVRNPSMDFAADGTAADHAYWLSGIAVRGSGRGRVDARSAAFGTGDPPALATQRGAGALTGGSLGTIAYTSQAKAWGAAPKRPAADALAITARNVRSLTVTPARARISCAAKLTIATDGPLDVTLAGCGRVESVASAGTVTRVGAACARPSALRGARVRPRGHRLRVTLPRRAAVDLYRHSRGRRVTKAVRVRHRRARQVSFGALRPGYYSLRVRAGGDTRRYAVRRAHGRWVRRPAFTRRAGCAMGAFRLSAPVFGGRTARPLRITARGRLDLMRGGRRIRRIKGHRVRPRGLRRGTYGVRLTAGKRHRTLHAVKL
jgi:hypothetical protein